MISKKRKKTESEKAGSLVSKIRNKWDMTFAALAAELGVNQVTLYRWINGDSAPHPNNLRNLERIYQDGPKD
jgi:DNA-binding transcriptional regulator YiaG